MATVKFTSALKRFYPNLNTLDIPGATIAEILNALETPYPGLKDYLVDETGKLRQHVNIFIGKELIEDTIQLQDTVQANDEIYILQALSGG